MSHILIVDDEEAVCWALRKGLQSEGHQVAVASSAEEGFVLAKKQTPHVVILDVCLPGMDGLSALSKLRELSFQAPIIVITAFGNLSTAVRAVEEEAFDYLTKPFDLDQMLNAVVRALQRSASPAVSRESEAPGPEEMVGIGSAMQMVFKRIALVASRDSCVLITGESGTGKELVARAVHRYSPRREKPFLPVHVAALNPNLVESELFGHARGAFTGATQARTGMFALANGGTIFLDEVGEIPLGVQVKLLRVLENNEVMPVGSNQAEPINVRILAATHQNLEQKVAEGSFRQDLYFRLNGFQIHLPPLRERREDITPLVQHILAKLGSPHWPLLPVTAQFLQEQSWLGNIRELRHSLEHAVILARGGPLSPEHFPITKSPASFQPKEQLRLAVLQWVQERIQEAGKEAPHDLYEAFLACVEPPLLEEVMRRLQGNRLMAAQWLGLNRATVRKKLGLYGLSGVPTPEEDE